MTASLEVLREAIREFDATEAARESNWNNAETAADVESAESADRQALAKVQEAFWQATKDRNSRENCSLVDIQFMRKIAALDSL